MKPTMKRILSKQGTRRTKKKDHFFPAEFITFSSVNLIEKFDELIKPFEEKIPIIPMIKDLLSESTITHQMKWMKSILSTKINVDEFNRHQDQYNIAIDIIISILFDTPSKILHPEITKYFKLLHKDSIAKDLFMNLFTLKFKSFIQRLENETVIQNISDINWDNIQILNSLIFQSYCEDLFNENSIIIYRYLSEIMHFISVDIHTVDSLHSLVEEDKLEFLLAVLIQFNKQFSFDDKVNNELLSLISSQNKNASLEAFYKVIQSDESLIESLKNEIKTNTNKYTYLQLCKKMIESTLDILRSPLCSKDANYSSGMWIMTISKSFFKEYNQDNLIPFSLTYAYSIYCEKLNESTSYSIIDLLLDAPIEKPVFCKGLNDLPPVAQLAILRAIPIVYSCQHESYRFDKESDLPLLIRPFPDDKSTFLFDAYFELCHRWNNVTSDRYTRFLSFKCIEAFLILVISILKKFPSSSILHLKKNIPHILNTVLDLIWKNWEDPFDSIVGVIRVLFTYLLNISDLSIELYGDEPSYGSAYINNIVSNLLSMDWSTKGKYPLLQTMIKRQGAEHIFSLEPKLMYHLFHTLSYNPYAKHIANISECILNDLKTTNPQKAETIWLEPFLKSILDIRSYEPTTIYILPIILNLFPSSITLILKRILENNGTIEQIQVSAALSVLKVARRNGIISGDSLLNNISDSGDINISISTIIQKAMNCIDPVIRLDALQLISDSRKLTEFPNEIELSNLQSYLHSTLSHTALSFRTKSYPHLELIFQRIKDGAQSKFKRVKDDKIKDELNSTINYVENLCRKVTWGMYSSSSFHRKTTAYEFFSLLVNLFGAQPTKGCNFNDLANIISRDFKIFHPDSVKFVISGIFDSYDQNRIIAHRILTKCDGKLPGFEERESFIPLIKWAIKTLTSPRMRECDSASLILRIIVEKYITQSGWSIRVQNNGENIEIETNSCFSLDKRVVMFLDDIHKTLIFYHNQRKEDDSNTISLHGLIMAIRYIINDFPFNKIQDTEVWSDFLRRIIETSKEISLKSLDITHSIRYRLDDNNEDDSEIDDVDQFIIVVTWLNIKEIAFLLGCIVKSLLPNKATSLNNILEVKEIEAIGQHLLDTLLVLRHRGAIETTADGFQVVCEALTKCNIVELKELPQKWLNQLLYRIEYTPRQLMSTRRSAGLPYAFIALLKSEAFTEHDRKVHNLLPRAFKHLLQTVNRIEEPQDPSIKPEFRHQVHSLNVIRAILRDRFLIEDVGPFVEEILMIVIKLYTSSIWAVQNSATMTFSALIERCTGSKQSFDDGGDNINRKIMSGITISDFFTRFPNTHPFLVKAVNESLQNVQTDSSYVHKILKNSNYEGESGSLNISNENQSEQRQSSKKLASLATSLYAVLVLITRLIPGRMESPKERHLTEPFLKAVLESSVSSDWMVRKLSARALVRLIPTKSFPSFLNGFIESLPSSRELCFKEFERNTTNQLHGILLSIYYLLKGHLPLIIFNDVLDDLFNNIMPKIQKFNWIFETNVHPLSSQLLLIIYEFVMRDLNVSQYSAVNQMKQTYNEISKHILLNSGIYTPVMDHSLIETAAKVSVYYALHFETNKEEALSFIIFALNHPYYEARISTLELIEDSLKSDNIDNNEFVRPLIQLLGIHDEEYDNKYGFIENNVKAISIIFSVLNSLKILPYNLLVKCKPSNQDGKENLWTYIERIVESRNNYSDSLVQSALEFMGTIIKELTQLVIANKYDFKHYSIMLDLWNQFCLTYGNIDMPLEYRQSAAASLTHCVLSIEFYNKLKDNTEDDHLKTQFIKYWLNVIKLLQDDDDDIRALIVPLCSSMISPTNANESVNLLLNVHMTIELCYHNLSLHMGDSPFYIDHLISNLTYKCPTFKDDDKNVIFEVDKENYFIEECFIAQISRRELDFVFKNYNGIKTNIIKEWATALEKELNSLIINIKDNNDFYGEWNMYNEDIFNGLYINLLGVSTIIDYDKEFYKDSSLLNSIQDFLDQKSQFIHPLVLSLIKYIVNRRMNVEVECDSLNFLLGYNN